MRNRQILGFPQRVRMGYTVRGLHGKQGSPMNVNAATWSAQAQLTKTSSLVYVVN
ncbi:MAG: hypothetical protein WCO86_02080 [Planctomycetota bacterium]|nr:hypothetical protein [Planctomycetales bacterium]